MASSLLTDSEQEPMYTPTLLRHGKKHKISPPVNDCSLPLAEKEKAKLQVPWVVPDATLSEDILETLFKGLFPLSIERIRLPLIDGDREHGRSYDTRSSDCI